MKYVLRCPKICFINDDETELPHLKELTQKDFPTANVLGFDALVKAYGSVYSLLVVDVSAVTEDMLHPEWAFGPISHYLQNHGAPKILIVSSMSLNAVDDFVEDLRNYLPEECKNRVFAGGWAGNWEALKNKIKELHPESEFWMDLDKPRTVNV